VTPGGRAQTSSQCETAAVRHYAVVLVLGLTTLMACSGQTKTQATVTVTAPGSTGASSTGTSPSASAVPPVRSADLRSTVLAGKRAFVDASSNVTPIFATVSGNIACTMLAVAAGRVACTVYAHDNWPRSKCGPGPSVVVLDTAGARETGCTPNISAPRARSGLTLPYGQTLVVGNDACLDESDKLTCVDLLTGAGFEVNRESFTAFGPYTATRTCSTETLDQVAVPNSRPIGQFTVTDVKFNNTGPLWTVYGTQPVPSGSGQGQYVVAYCGRSGWLVQGAATVPFWCSAVPQAALEQMQITCPPPRPSAEYPAALSAADKVATSTCQTYAYAMTQPAVGMAGPLVSAGEQAADAAALDPKWSPLKAQIAVVVQNLHPDRNGEATPNPSLPTIAQICATLGVNA
jgi:hypothetical protein